MPGEEVGFIRDIGGGALGEAQGIPFPPVAFGGDGISERAELVGARGGDRGCAEGGEGRGLVECGWGGKEVEDKGGESLRGNVEGER